MKETICVSLSLSQGNKQHHIDLISKPSLARGNISNPRPSVLLVPSTEMYALYRRMKVMRFAHMPRGPRRYLE